jgi:hypothetical protein
MRALAAKEPDPYGFAETAQFLSEPALTAIQNLAEPHERDMKELAGFRARIRAAASALQARWRAPNLTWGSYGARSGDERRKPFTMNDYDRSISLDLRLLDYSEHQPSAELMRAVAEDLEIKLADCESRGSGGGPQATIGFLFTTIKPPKQEIKGEYVLFYKDVKQVGLEKVTGQKTQWRRHDVPGPTSVNIVPGTYYMYVQNATTNDRTLCDAVPVGSRARIDWQFLIARLSKGEGCPVP